MLKWQIFEHVKTYNFQVNRFPTQVVVLQIKVWIKVTESPTANPKHMQYCGSSTKLWCHQIVLELN